MSIPIDERKCEIPKLIEYLNKTKAKLNKQVSLCIHLSNVLCRDPNATLIDFVEGVLNKKSSEVQLEFINEILETLKGW